MTEAAPARPTTSVWPDELRAGDGDLHAHRLRARHAAHGRGERLDAGRGPGGHRGSLVAGRRRVGDEWEGADGAPLRSMVGAAGSPTAPGSARSSTRLPRSPAGTTWPATRVTPSSAAGRTALSRYERRVLRLPHRRSEPALRVCGLLATRLAGDRDRDAGVISRRSASGGRSVPSRESRRRHHRGQGLGRGHEHRVGHLARLGHQRAEADAREDVRRCCPGRSRTVRPRARRRRTGCRSRRGRGRRSSASRSAGVASARCVGFDSGRSAGRSTCARHLAHHRLA